jgi:hypothetical protein
LDSGITLALSFLIGGIFLMTVLNTQANIQKTATINLLEENVHTKMDGLREIIKTDLEKIGYNIDLDEVSQPMVLKKKFGSKHNNYIKFYMDVKSVHGDDADNDLDSIAIWSGPTGEMNHTENDSDRYVYRKVNDNDSTIIGSGVTYFELEALDRSELVPGQDIIVISLEIETPYMYEEQYFSAIWKGRICPKNLRK